MNKMAVAGIVGGILIAPILIPFTLFSLYGWDMNHRHEKELKIELATLVQGDLTESLIGIDKNKNGIRDSVEEFLAKKVPSFQTTDALIQRFIYAYQRSIDIKSVPEAERQKIYYDLAMVSECGNSVPLYLEGLTPVVMTTDTFIQEYQDLMYLGYHYVSYLDQNKEKIFLNTEHRRKAKEESDKYVGNKYRISIFDKNISTEDKARKCIDFARSTEITALAKKDETDSLVGIDQNNNGIRDTVEEYLAKNMKYMAAMELAKKFIYSYQRSIDIQSVPKPERNQVYNELAMTTGCLKPLLNYHRMVAQRDYEIALKPESNYYHVLKNDLLMVRALEYVELMQGNAEDLLLNTVERRKAKEASDLYADQHYKVDNIWGSEVSDESRLKMCLDYSQNLALNKTYALN